MTCTVDDKTLVCLIICCEYVNLHSLSKTICHSVLLKNGYEILVLNIHWVPLTTSSFGAQKVFEETGASK